MWQSLFTMCESFHNIALKLSAYFAFTFDEKEFNNVIEYLHAVKEDTSET
jgi:aminoglycoside 6-adenylyltransferase